MTTVRDPRIVEYETNVPAVLQYDAYLYARYCVAMDDKDYDAALEIALRLGNEFDDYNRVWYNRDFNVHYFTYLAAMQIAERKIKSNDLVAAYELYRDYEYCLDRSHDQRSAHARQMQVLRDHLDSILDYKLKQIECLTKGGLKVNYTFVHRLLLEISDLLVLLDKKSKIGISYFQDKDERRYNILKQKIDAIDPEELVLSDKTDPLIFSAAPKNQDQQEVDVDLLGDSCKYLP